MKQEIACTCSTDLRKGRKCPAAYPPPNDRKQNVPHPGTNETRAMVLTGCLRIQHAYDAIEWSVTLIPVFWPF